MHTSQREWVCCRRRETHPSCCSRCRKREQPSECQTPEREREREREPRVNAGKSGPRPAIGAPSWRARTDHDAHARAPARPARDSRQERRLLSWLVTQWPTLVLLRRPALSKAVAPHTRLLQLQTRLLRRLLVLAPLPLRRSLRLCLRLPQQLQHRPPRQPAQPAQHHRRHTPHHRQAAPTRPPGLLAPVCPSHSASLNQPWRRPARPLLARLTHSSSEERPRRAHTRARLAHSSINSQGQSRTLTRAQATAVTLARRRRRAYAQPQARLLARSLRLLAPRLPPRLPPLLPHNFNSSNRLGSRNERRLRATRLLRAQPAQPRRRATATRPSTTTRRPPTTRTTRHPTRRSELLVLRTRPRAGEKASSPPAAATMRRCRTFREGRQRMTWTTTRYSPSTEARSSSAGA